jgi:hypothetical protein
MKNTVFAFVFIITAFIQPLPAQENNEFDDFIVKNQTNYPVKFYCPEFSTLFRVIAAYSPKERPDAVPSDWLVLAPRSERKFPIDDDVIQHMIDTDDASFTYYAETIPEGWFWWQNGSREKTSVVYDSSGVNSIDIPISRVTYQSIGTSVEVILSESTLIKAENVILIRNGYSKPVNAFLGYYKSEKEYVPVDFVLNPGESGTFFTFSTVDYRFGAFVLLDSSSYRHWGNKPSSVSLDMLKERTAARLFGKNQKFNGNKISVQILD